MGAGTIKTNQSAAAIDASAQQFAADVQYYLALSPRQLPSWYLYDALGSALFEAICRLPWYGITRAESRLLATHGADVFRQLEPVSAIVELGSGSGEKLKMLIAARDPHSSLLNVHLVDLSASALEHAAQTLGSLEQIRLFAHQDPYETGLHEAVCDTDDAGRTLVLFLGSNIGNFDPPGTEAFLRGIRANLAGGDALLLGADLIKPERELTLGYDDPLGVTAAFNRNLLVRINRELGGDFDVSQFTHRVVWNAEASRIEMHLVARSAQRVRISAAQFEFSLKPGEVIWTESSYKYRARDIVGLLERAGFRFLAQWVDEQDAFALTLVEAVEHA
jgi:dimethylhistidine N-methyltransferase